MPTPLLVKDVLVEVSFGTTAQGGATPVPADPVSADPNYECQAKSLRVSIQSSTVDLSTLCSGTNTYPLSGGYVYNIFDKLINPEASTYFRTGCH